MAFSADVWKCDEMLSSSLKKYVVENYTRKEILLFMERDFPQYLWSLRTLDRRLKNFDIFYCKSKMCCISDVKKAVAMELDGVGQCLGYRAMHKKINMIHGIPATREMVYNVMHELAPELLKERRPCFKRKIRPGHYVSPGPNFMHSLDGHDKLMGYQNWTFPIAIYGSLDSCSRKVMWIKVWPSNHDPKVIGKFYLEFLVKSKTLPKMLRMDRGSETGVMATIHAFLTDKADVCDGSAVESIIYGPSTSNQIERWWRDLHERLEKYFKPQLINLVQNNHYDPSNQMERDILAYIMVPVVQREIDTFVELWNTHRIRPRKGAILPSGIPNHIFAFPSEYGLKQCGTPVTDSQLAEVATLSGALDVAEDFMPKTLREKCAAVIANPLDTCVNECALAYRFLKEKVCLANHNN